MNARTSVVDMPPLVLRADVASYNADDRTAELIFSTGAPVERFDWMTGQRYIEKLSMEPAHIKLDRLNSGAPLLDSHSSWSVTDQLGAVVPGTARVEKGKAIATVKFSSRESVAPILQDVREGIIRSVSVGYRVHRFEEQTPKGQNKLPIRTATEWEPFEVSLVSMPADVHAKVRKDDIPTNQCVIVSRQERTMNDEQRHDGQSETIDERAGEQRLNLANETPVEKSPADLAREAERKRINGIWKAVRAAALTSEFGQRLIDEGLSLEDAQTRVFDEWERRGAAARRAGPDPNARPDVRLGDDPFIHKRAGIENALLHRVNPEKFALDEKGREYRGMSVLDIAKAFLRARGVRITDLPRMELAGVALGLTAVRGGMHTTSDFPLLLADVANKSLRADYEAAPQTFEPIVRRGTVPDFRTSNRVQIGDAPSLKPVGEHGEFTRGTIEEAREQVQAATYGRVFAITRQALVNDDLDAFSRVPTKFGRMAMNLVSDLVWYQIQKNANMSDSNALFSAAHLNYQAAGDITITNVTAGERAMMLQKGLDSTTLMNVAPKYLIVPPNKKTKALQFVSTTLQATTQGAVNPYAGQLIVICEPRLETGITIGTLSSTGSAYRWYLAGDKNVCDIVELVFLEGENGPVIESRVGFDVDGLELKCRLDVGAKVLDWRNLYMSDGSDAS